MVVLRQRALLLMLYYGIEDFTKARRAGALGTILPLSEEHVSKDTRSRPLPELPKFGCDPKEKNKRSEEYLFFFSFFF